MDLIDQLAELHAGFGLYPRLAKDQYEKINPCYNIVERLRRFPELGHLVRVYDQYIASYRVHVKESAEPIQSFAPGQVARNVDLFSIGERVLERREATFMFVFEGSLQESSRQSVNVLACLWALECFECKPSGIQSRATKSMPSDYREFVKDFWPPGHRFCKVMNSLHVTPRVARRAYVTDAVRIPRKGAKNAGKPDSAACQELLRREADLLRPRKVIAVGDRAKEHLGQLDDLVIHVPFPTAFIRRSKLPWAREQWDQLPEIYALYNEFSGRPAQTAHRAEVKS